MVHGSRHEDSTSSRCKASARTSSSSNNAGVRCASGLHAVRRARRADAEFRRGRSSWIGKVHLLNPGSGQPRTANKSCFALYDDVTRKVIYFRAEYDFKLTQQHIREAGIDERMARRLEAGR